MLKRITSLKLLLPIISNQLVEDGFEANKHNHSVVATDEIDRNSAICSLIFWSSIHVITMLFLLSKLFCTSDINMNDCTNYVSSTSNNTNKNVSDDESSHSSNDSRSHKHNIIAIEPPVESTQESHTLEQRRQLILDRIEQERQTERYSRTQVQHQQQRQQDSTEHDIAMFVPIDRHQTLTCRHVSMQASEDRYRIQQVGTFLNPFFLNPPDKER